MPKDNNGKPITGNGKTGISGEFRFIRQHGVDKYGYPLSFDELVEGTPGELKPIDPSTVLEDRSVKNKFLKRGLAFFQYLLLADHSGGPYAVSDITSLPSDNPFFAFIMVADETSQGKSADARVEFDESDGTYNVKIPRRDNYPTTPAVHVVGEGRRGILLNDTTGPGIRRVSIDFPTTSPYRQIEYVFFAQANPGGAIETADDEIDNFPMKAVGMAHDVDCGDTEDNSRWGIRAVLGVAPTFQGVSDRVYQHEGSGLTYYTGSTILSTDGYIQSSQSVGQGGDKAFDGYVKQEGLDGSIDLGDHWASTDNTGPHMIGRVWASTKTIAGIRIIMPAGTNKDLAPDLFKTRYLDPSANGGNPRPGNDADWVDVSGENYLSTSQATNIFDGGQYGYEYVFGTPISCNGIKISSISAFGTGRGVEVAELMAFEEMSAVALSSDTLRLATDGVPSYRAFSLADRSATQDVQDLADAINVAVRGYELEAVRSEFGFLWVRSTVAGDNSQADLDSVANGSSANTKLGLWTAGGSKTGVTQSVTKGQNDALTIIYRAEISGDAPTT